MTPHLPARQRTGPEHVPQCGLRGGVVRQRRAQRHRPSQFTAAFRQHRHDLTLKANSAVPGSGPGSTPRASWRIEGRGPLCRLPRAGRVKQPDGEDQRPPGIGPLGVFRLVGRPTHQADTLSWCLRRWIALLALRAVGPKFRLSRAKEKFLQVGLRGLEPRTSSLSGKRSNRLSYSPRLCPLNEHAGKGYRIVRATAESTVTCPPRMRRTGYSVSRRVTSTPPIRCEVRL